MQPSVSEFLKDNKTTINQKNFKELYNKAMRLKDTELFGYVFEIAEAFYKIGIDPLKDGDPKYEMHVVPEQYLAWCDIVPKQLPETILEIGRGAFAANGSFDTIKLPGELVTIGPNAFSHSNIKQIVIPKSVQVIDDRAFKSCTKLERVIIESNPFDIGQEVFAQCPKLKNILLKDPKCERPYISGIPCKHI
ncbi:MAG: leucine-rich repeat domain-containing protein [Acholeplasmatales bacterium]|nr:leucine-rich repeat domain-containing protein [Acholeplasmatales bacterium]